MPPQIIPPPNNVSPEPDQATKRALRDLTGPTANNRVLYVNLGFARFGTSDKIQGAAMVLAAFLFLFLVGITIAGFIGANAAWADKAFQWTSGAFLFVAGVALGKAASGRKRPEEDDDD